MRERGIDRKRAYTYELESERACARIAHRYITYIESYRTDSGQREREREREREKGI